MQKNKVFITGISTVSSLGTGIEDTLKNLSSKEPPIYIPSDNERYKYPYFKIDGKFDGYRDLIRNSAISLNLISCIEDKLSGFTDIPLFLSTSTGGIRETEEAYAGLKKENANYPLFKRHFFDATINDINKRYKDKFSDACTFSTACSSSGHSIFQAYKFIKSGIIDKAVIIGVDSLALTTMIGFDSLKLVSHTGTRPLSTDRDGLSLGEGGGVLLLESDPANPPLCEITGCASNSDGYHISSPNPEGTSQKECILRAVEDSDITTDDIQYINAHGTGTPMNDEIEMKVIKSLFNNKITVTSLKAFIGHTLGASAALEIAITLIMLKSGKIYQPACFKNPMDEVVPVKTMDANGIRYFLKNSFGFGGNNVSIILKTIS